MAHGMVPQVRGLNLKFKSGLNPEFEFALQSLRRLVSAARLHFMALTHCTALKLGRSWCCDRRHKKGMRSQKVLSSKKALRGKRIA